MSPCLLESLLNNSDSITDNMLIDNFIGLFSAGMDTTAHTTSMLLYLLSIHPDCLEKATEEIEEFY